MNINNNRDILFKEYKLNNNKEALKQLIITFLPNIKRIVKSFEYSNIEDTLIYIAIEATVDCINNFELKNDIGVLCIYVHKYIKSRIESYLKKIKKNQIELEPLPLNGENGTSYDMEFVLNKIFVKQMLDYLSEKDPIGCEILKLRYGIDCNFPMTLMEIAKIKNISFQAVKQREDQTLILLKKKFKNKI